MWIYSTTNSSPVLYVFVYTLLCNKACINTIPPQEFVGYPVDGCDMYLSIQAIVDIALQKPDVVMSRKRHRKQETIKCMLSLSGLLSQTRASGWAGVL